MPLTLALANVAIGCGSSAGGTAGESDYTVQASTTMTVASPPLTQAQFVARVNGICRKAWLTLLENWDSYTSTQEHKQSERKRFEEAVELSLLAGIDFHIFDAIRQLGSPEGEEHAIERIIGPMQMAVELGQLGRWQAQEVADIPPQFAVYDERAHRYGLDDCLIDEAHLSPIEQ